jgi:hypothetical protein
MARLARVIAVGVPHHITQRGNARRFILQDEADRCAAFPMVVTSPVPKTPGVTAGSNTGCYAAP